MLGFAPLGAIPLGDDGQQTQRTGELTAAFGALTGTLDGKVYVQGQTSYALAAVGLTADGDVPRTGALSVQLAALAYTADGWTERLGTLSYSLAALTGTISGVRDQKGNPDADVTTNSWTNELGGTTNLYASIDEAEANDGDYISSPTVNNGSTSYYECSLEPLSDPLSSSSHIVRYRLGRASGSGSVTITVSLRQGASTEIASWQHTSPSTVTYAQTLTAGQADAITDYGDLRLRFHLATGPAGLGGEGEL